MEVRLAQLPINRITGEVRTGPEDAPFIEVVAHSSSRRFYVLGTLIDLLNLSQRDDLTFWGNFSQCTPLKGQEKCSNSVSHFYVEQRKETWFCLKVSWASGTKSSRALPTRCWTWSRLRTCWRHEAFSSEIDPRSVRTVIRAPPRLIVPSMCALRRPTLPLTSLSSAPFSFVVTGNSQWKFARRPPT